jgi:hypothetical protein
MGLLMQLRNLWILEGRERRLGFLEGLCILEESLAICKPKTQKSQKFAAGKKVPIT